MIPTIHKILWVISYVIILMLAVYLGLSFFLTWLKIVLFGLKLVFFPLIIFALVYMMWHIRKFFK